MTDINPFNYEIPFNKPYMVGTEQSHIAEALRLQNLSADGMYTRRCQSFFEETYGMKRTFLTSSCTDALEMAAILSNVGPGDEVIMPSYTFVSTANAFALRGANVVFCDSAQDNPNIDVAHAESLITDRTRAIVIVHYAGVACQVEGFVELAKKYDLLLVEDCAHAIDSFFHSQALGTFGDLSTFSFHQTKNITCGEGGLLAVNNPELIERAEIIWTKGTNRCAFQRGETAKYTWVDLGSSFQPSEITAAFLWGQLEALKSIQAKRVSIWEQYDELLVPLERAGQLKLPAAFNGGTCNGHLFYVVCENESVRARLIEHLRVRGILAVFHYIPLHSSPYYLARHEKCHLPNAERFAATLLRLPFYFDLAPTQVQEVVAAVSGFYLNK